MLIVIIIILLQLFLDISYSIPILKETSLRNLLLGNDGTTPNKYPFQVALKFSNINEPVTILCGGSIISEKFVMTAAHCVDGYNNVQILFGAHDLRKSSKTERTRIVKSVDKGNFIIHPKWDSNTLVYDIALIRVDVPFNDHIKKIPICCVSEPIEDAIASGWGKTTSFSLGLSPVLRDVELKYVPNAKCEKRIALTETNICYTGVGIPKKGTCNGDSGGPLFKMTSLSNQYCQIGLTSYGEKFCDSFLAPSVFTNLQAVMDFIENEADIVCND